MLPKIEKGLLGGAAARVDAQQRSRPRRPEDTPCLASLRQGMSLLLACRSAVKCTEVLNEFVDMVVFKLDNAYMVVGIMTLWRKNDLSAETVAEHCATVAAAAFLGCRETGALQTNSTLCRGYWRERRTVVGRSSVISGCRRSFCLGGSRLLLVRAAVRQEIVCSS